MVVTTSSSSKLKGSKDFIAQLRRDYPEFNFLPGQQEAGQECPAYGSDTASTDNGSADETP